MKIGIDLSVLQSHHKYRGIGSVIVNFLNNLDEKDKKKYSFVFFVEEKDQDEAFEQLTLDGVKYETRILVNKKYAALPGPLNIIPKAFHKAQGFAQYYTGDPRLSRATLKDIDHFIQFDQNRKLPSGASRSNVLFLHDIIPYVMESDYLWSFKTARLNGRSFKGSVKFAFLRFQYVSRIKINARRADILLANSQHTKSDFVNHLGIPAKKIVVTPLGMNISTSKTADPQLSSYRSTMWGDVKTPLDALKKPYLLFVGGTDHRRKMTDLLAAFNNLRARGHDISMIISGDAVKGVKDIKNPVMKKYLEENTSYADDTHLIGYITNDQRDWLYQHALAFVFPSVYEGFGLPVLEAMSQGAPVITYNNTAIAEAAGDKALFATGPLDIIDHVETLLEKPSFRETISKEGRAHAEQFTWSKTKDGILRALKK